MSHNAEPTYADQLAAAQELVKRTDAAVEKAAKAAHTVSRAYAVIIGEELPAWSAAPAWMKQPVRSGVRVVLESWRVTPEQLHERWVAHKQRDGWKFGPVKDADKKTHPCMVGYDELPDEQRVKDSIFGAVVRSVLRRELGIDG